MRGAAVAPGGARAVARRAPLHGRAVQLDPIKPALKAPGIKRLKLICNDPLSNFAFKFNLRHYTMALAIQSKMSEVLGRGSHSSTFRLNVSAFCGSGGRFRGYSGAV
jgi:hypothetical protein